MFVPSRICSRRMERRPTCKNTEENPEEAICRWRRTGNFWVKTINSRRRKRTSPGAANIRGKIPKSYKKEEKECRKN
jgi:hypothetical protein